MVKITDDLLQEYFENNFLVRVAFEIRFPADLTLKNDIPEFQGSIKDNFSTYEERFSIRVPFEKIESSNLLDYAFINDKDQIEIYINKYSHFGLTTQEYPGFRAFRNTFCENLKKFTDLNKIKNITRLGIRYVNIIPLDESKEKSNSLLTKFFISPLKDGLFPYKFENQRIDLRYNQEDYEIHLQFIFRKSRQNIYEGIIDLDIAYTYKIPIEEKNDNILKTIDELHHLIKVKFFDLITEDFLVVLKKKKGD